MPNSHTNNPCGLRGFAFLEFSHTEPNFFDTLFTKMGFCQSAKHANAPITRYDQGAIQFIVNTLPNSQAYKHAETHGPGACAMGFLVDDAQLAFNYTTSKGAEPFIEDTDITHNLLGIKAIGGSVIYFVDEINKPFKNDWQFLAKPTNTAGLKSIDHLTHNVYRGNLDKWAEYYERLFNFREIRYFDIQGQMTGLLSRAMASPEGSIKIPLNESKDEHSQIEEFLHEYHGEGIQHIALTTDNIYETVSSLRNNGTEFLDVPDTYYEMINDRINWHKEPVDRLQNLKILIDGEKTPEKGLLLQIFTSNVMGPVFFEIIQRKGNEGFGEGNFKALFEAIERDQMKRGVL